MSARRLLLAASLACALLASDAQGGTGYRLDGRRAREKRWTASLGAASVPVNGATRDPLTPALDDCGPQSCDVHELRLTLPEGVSWGSLRATVVLPRELVAAVVLYDDRGQWIDSRDGLTVVESDTHCCEDVGYTLEIYRERLAAGTYTLAVHDRGGSGSFDATVRWVAKPPDRARHR